MYTPFALTLLITHFIAGGASAATFSGTPVGYYVNRLTGIYMGMFGDHVDISVPSGQYTPVSGYNDAWSTVVLDLQLSNITIDLSFQCLNVTATTATTRWTVVSSSNELVFPVGRQGMSNIHVPNIDYVSTNAAPVKPGVVPCSIEDVAATIDADTTAIKVVAQYGAWSISQ